MDGLLLWSPGVTLDQIEKQVIEMAFKHFKGNKSATSLALGITTKTLDNKFERYAAEEKIRKEKETEHARRQSEFLARQRGIRTTPDGQIFVPGKPGDPALAPSSPVKEADAGLRVQPASDSSQKHAMPMPQRKEVQSVLPSTPTKSHSGKSR